MSDTDLVKSFLSKMVQAVELVERTGELTAAAKALEARVASLKKNEADLVFGYHAVRDKAEAEARVKLEAAHAEVAKMHADTDRELQAKTDHAKAELETIAQQRHRLETEIAALSDRAAELRSLVEQGRQQLAQTNDAIAVASALHEQTKGRLAELKKAL